MGKYNKSEGDDGELGPEDKTCKGRMKRLYRWGRANPLKVVIISLCIINLSLIISIPIKDWQIENYPDEVEQEKTITEGRRVRKADHDKWKK